MLVATACATVTESPPAAVEGSPPATEPVVLDLPGWAQAEGTPSADNERVLVFSDGEATVELIRWWGMPETDGGPMEVSGVLTTYIEGEPTEMLLVKVLDGEPVNATVLFLRGGGWLVRVACHHCNLTQFHAMQMGLSVSD